MVFLTFTPASAQSRIYQKSRISWASRSQYYPYCSHLFHDTHFLQNVCLRRSEKQHSWKYLAASMSQQVSICLFSGRDFVPATEFSNKCQCCSQSSRNSAQKTNGEGKHNSFFLIANLYRTLRSTGWWHSDLDNEHDIFIVILSSLNVSTPVTIHQCTRRGSSLPFLHISFIPVWLHLR